MPFELWKASKAAIRRRMDVVARWTVGLSVNQLRAVRKLGREAPGAADAVCALYRDGYLGKTGWFVTFATRSAVDAKGEALPWLTYAAIEFLAPRVDAGMQVFEYGAGSSTLWWAQRVGRVTSCEHDAGWCARVRAMAPSNVTLVAKEYEDVAGYARAALDSGRTYHVIVIDGRHRVECARNAVPALRREGVIIWDNSDRPEYHEGYDFLQSAGFRRLDFIGMGPINIQSWSTSVFYRSQNCLGL